jgi:aminoglycoside phosphotransferase (APT) family kinase protein
MDVMASARSVTIQTRQLLTARFPHLAIAKLVVLQTGGDHVTVAVNDDLIFRFPRDAATAAKTPREIRLLAALAPALPVPIPTVVYVGRTGEQCPFIFTGQRRIAGVMGELLRPPREHWPSLARQTGRFFSALHAFPLERAVALGLAALQPELAAELVAEVASYADDLRQLLPDLAAGPAAPYLRGAVVVPPSTAALVTSHADVKGEHLFVSADGATLTGVIDWSDAAVCDPANDLGNLLIWLGGGFLRLVLPHYAGPDDATLSDRAIHRVRYAGLRAIGRRLAGQSDDPLDLIVTQLRWAFSEH